MHGEAGATPTTSERHRRPPRRPAGKDELWISAELAQLLFAARGGSVTLARNPLTRSLRVSVTARLPLA